MTLGSGDQLTQMKIFAWLFVFVKKKKKKVKSITLNEQKIVPMYFKLKRCRMPDLLIKGNEAHRKAAKLQRITM